MSVAYSIVPASIRHVRPMSKRLRAAACITLQGFGYEPRAALHRAFISSFYCRTALIDEKPVAMWGVAGTVLGDSAYVWLVLSDDVGRLPRAVVREAKAALERVAEDYRQVSATVLPDDDASVRFALHLGFGGTIGGTMGQIEQDVLTNQAYRIPIGDSYAIQLAYRPAMVN